MATTSSSVVAFFSTEAQAAEAISALKSAGFQAHQIGAAANAGSSSAGYGSTGSASGMGSTSGTGSTSHSNMSQKTEGVWDKVKSFFEGDEGSSSYGQSTGSGFGSSKSGDVEQYADKRARDGASHEITSGSALGSSAGSYGYDENYYESGDLSHSLTGMQVPDTHSRYFEHRLSSGTGVLVTVSAAGREAEAERILTQFGGDLGSNAGSYDYSAATNTSATTIPATGQQRIQLLGEVLRVHKDRISRGEVRIRKEVITEQQTIQVPVTREELVIERIPVTGSAIAQGTIGQSNEIRIPLSEEQASIEKQTVVREEVAVGKRAIEEVQQVGGAVRHEELEVEDATTEGIGLNAGTTTGRL